jgi:hypothetical protein
MDYHYSEGTLRGRCLRNFAVRAVSGALQGAELQQLLWVT